MRLSVSPPSFVKASQVREIEDQSQLLQTSLVVVEHFRKNRRSGRHSDESASDRVDVNDGRKDVEREAERRWKRLIAERAIFIGSHIDGLPNRFPPHIDSHDSIASAWDSHNFSKKEDDTPLNPTTTEECEIDVPLRIGKHRTD